MSDKEKQILNELLAKFDKYENECFEKIQFLTEHNFGFEKMYIEGRRNAFYRCLQDLKLAIYDINELKDENI